ncbi:MAG TPA: molybdate ABC transporter permease subunit [Candidatus Deferrimicrobiaceae bacterium]|jgi:molybdate transport system permease protein
MLAPSDYEAILLSLKVGAAATLLSLPLGFGAAALLAYGKFRGKTIVEVFVNLPLTLPPVVVGYLLLLLLGESGPLGPLFRKLGFRLIFTWRAAVIASMVVGFPLLVRAIRLSMESIDPALPRTARTLGATRLDALFSVVVPLSIRGILAGAALMFARSLGEFGATVLVAGNIPGVTQTLPLAIYDYAASPGGEGSAGALCVVSVAISVGVLFAHEWIARRAGREG